MAMKTERLVAKCLFWGGVASVALMLAGLGAVEIHARALGQPVDAWRIVENRQAGRSVDVFVSVAQLSRALRQWPPDPVAVMTAGILTLLVTPAIGVAAALAGFIAARDGMYSIISTVLIGALLFGLVFRLSG
jgi:uncharacterized membrane protein